MQRISSNLLLHESAHALSYLHPTPVLPGHCVVFPRQQYQKLSEIPASESLDLWSEVQSLSSALKSYYSAPALTIELKDQVHPFLFINIIPRQSGDLQSNDMIYPLLEASNEFNPNEELSEQAESIRKALVN